MKQLKKYCIGMLLLVTLLFVTACGSSKNDVAPDDTGNGTAADGTGEGDTGGNGTNIDDILFDTDGDGVYDHTDVDGDGLLEQICQDSDDVVDDLVNDVTGGDGMDADGDGVEDDTVAP